MARTRRGEGTGRSRRPGPARRPRGGQPTRRAPRARRAAAPTRLPVAGRISSDYGMRTHPITGKQKLHGGIDIAVRTGTSVRATGAGKVARAGWENAQNHKQGFGRRVTIDHGNGSVSIYAHLSQIDVEKGNEIAQGQVIGKSGNSGASTSPHLHYEERYQGKAHPPTFDPAGYQPDGAEG